MFLTRIIPRESKASGVGSIVQSLLAYFYKICYAQSGVFWDYLSLEYKVILNNAPLPKFSS
jgi:hypothetical protein